MTQQKENSQGKRKMLIEWTEKINRMIIEEQLNVEMETGIKIKKQDAAISLIERLSKK